MTRALAIMTRTPVPGRVKARLAASMGQEAAAALYRGFLLDAVERARRLEACELYVAFTPARSRGLLGDLLGGDVRLLAQCAGDLGARMAGVLGQLLSLRHTSVVVSGADLPTLPLPTLRRAFDLLESAALVLGPSVDGGYYLIGLRAEAPGLFSGIDWGTARVLSQTMDRVDRLGLAVRFLDPWYDVDTEADLDLLVAHLRLLTAAGTPDLPRHTIAALQQLGLLAAGEVARVQGT